MKRKLDYNVPPIRCFLHHAFPFGVFWDENDIEVMKWFCANFNYLFCSKNPADYCFSYLIDYHNVPFLIKRSIYGDELVDILKNYSFYSFIQKMIDTGNFIEVIIDEFYLSESILYKREHFMHEFLIVGYDKERETIIGRQYFNETYKEVEVPYTDIIPYENGPYYGDNVVIKLYKKKIDTFTLTPELFWNQIQDYYYSINPYNKIGNFYGNIFLIWDKEFGINSFNIMLSEIEKQDYIDTRFFRLVYEHYAGMSIKLNFIYKQKLLGFKIEDKLLQFYSNLEIKAQNALLLSAKHNLLTDLERKNKVRKKVINIVKYLIEEEEKYLRVLLLENQTFL
ncbi:MAG: hypothetical protein ACLTC0_07440 [Eisenbergiella massiliensis]|uniref:hypothetical protein n=1 Tax=Eisenbergiella massiliensis TaxID=1720294 RepID=UPI0039932EC2